MIKSDLDRLDRRILNHLQRDNQISNVQLAEKIGLSPPACLRRVKRLRKSGAITADVSLLSQEVTGHKINIVVEVEMDRDQYALAYQATASLYFSDQIPFDTILDRVQTHIEAL